MTATRPRTVLNSRKPKKCDWCHEGIEISAPKVTWFIYTRASQINLHPECYHAAGKRLTSPNDTFPMPGEYKRGCWCGRTYNCRCTEPQHVTE